MKLLALVLSFALLAGCAYSASSHLIVGQVRPAIQPSQVKIYTTQPERYEEIAIVDASSQGSFSFTEQSRLDAALKLIKEEAAMLGANGLLLGQVNNEAVLAPITHQDGMVTYATGTYKRLKARAIYVRP
jgi:uncharacterized lipoprotein YajG